MAATKRSKSRSYNSNGLTSSIATMITTRLSSVVTFPYKLCRTGLRRFITTTLLLKQNNKAYQLLVNTAFETMDDSDSGYLDEAELYAGMLLVHLNIAKYAGPAACYPPTRTHCDALFQQADTDTSGGIDRLEFVYIVSELSKQILARMLVYWFVLLLSVPLLASTIIRILHVPTNTYYDYATREFISMTAFFLIVPTLWNYIERRRSTTRPTTNSIALKRTTLNNDSDTNTDTVTMTDNDEDDEEDTHASTKTAIINASTREAQRERRRCRRNSSLILNRSDISDGGD